LKALGAFLLGFVLGCAAQLQQERLFLAAIYLGFSLPGLYFIAWGWRTRAPVLVLGMAALALGFGITGLRATVFQSDALQPALEGLDIHVVGVVSAMPQRSEAGLRFRLDVESAELGGARTAAALPPSVYLGWYSQLLRAEDAASVPFAELQQGSGDLRAGERWAFTVRLKAPHGNANPHGFDYELWLWEQGLQATGYVRATPKDAANGTAPRRLGSTWQHPVERARQRVRDTIFSRVFEPRLAGVIAALVVGDQAAIERADWDIYRATGVAHLMSISGLHVTMFAWAAALCVGWLWRRSGRAMLLLPAQHAALVGGVLLAAGYALFSGWGVPSQRTVWMLATVALLRLSGKAWPWPLVWLLAMAVVVAVDPWALLQAGFWLSFVAVGVLFASGSGVQSSADTAQAPGAYGGAAYHTQVQEAPPTKLQRLQRAPWMLHARQMMREQWTITLALTPLSLLLFQQVSVVGLLANAIAIPWVTLVVTPLAMLGVLWPPFWDAAAACVQVLGSVLAWFALWPFATVSIAAYATFLGVAAVLGGILLAMQLPWPLRTMGAALLAPVLLWQPPRPASGQFELLAADIGQGNAVLVRTAGHSLLYDTGPRFSRESDAGQRTLVPLLRALGEKLDIVVLSHRDSDHIGGATAILAMQPQSTLLSSLEDGHELLNARATAQSAATSKTATVTNQAIGHPATQRCIAGQRWHWDGVDFQVLHPQAADYALQNRSNAMSCVLRISNGQRTALLVADIEAAQEASLVANAAPIKADVLLMPHHGSKTSSTAAFLDAVQPHIALGQSGYRNRFNHPAPEVALRYTERNIRLITSPLCGAATWRSEQPQAVVCQRALHQRYWHHTLP
jgi:competence protein ComEC